MNSVQLADDVWCESPIPPDREKLMRQIEVQDEPDFVIRNAKRRLGLRLDELEFVNEKLKLHPENEYLLREQQRLLGEIKC